LFCVAYATAESRALSKQDLIRVSLATDHCLKDPRCGWLLALPSGTLSCNDVANLNSCNHRRTLTPGSAGSTASFSATRDGAFRPVFLRLRNAGLQTLFTALKFFFAEAFPYLHQTQLELL
jgi:hypothetical protein